MHYHVSRIDINLKTREETRVDVGIAEDYMQARAAKWQDEKQFRTPAADRRIGHRWESRPCHEDSHIVGPLQKRHGVR